MKSTLIFSLMTIALLSLTACSLSPDVIDYNNSLVDLQKVCYAADDNMIDARDDENYGQTKDLYNITVSICADSEVKIAQMEARDWDSSLRDAFDAELKIELAYLAKIGEAIAYWDFDELTDEQTAAQAALRDEIDTLEEQFNAASDASEAIQEAFAQKYNFELED